MLSVKMGINLSIVSARMGILAMVLTVKVSLCKNLAMNIKFGFKFSTYGMLCPMHDYLTITLKTHQ